MNYSYKGGAIELHGKYYEYAKYDISNDSTSITLDGKGGLLAYNVANDRKYVPNPAYLTMALDGKKIDVYTEKTVRMIGRTQNITLDDEDFTVDIMQFAAKEINGVFWDISVSAAKASEFELTLDIGGAIPGKEMPCDKADAMYSSPCGIGCSHKGLWISDNHSFYIDEKLNGKLRVKLFLTFNSNIENVRNVVENFDSIKKSVADEIVNITLPASAVTEQQKAFYYSCYFCALENYKKVGGFRAFGAGCNYLIPMRTYFRDSYWTVLAMYNGRTQLVRDQILTLCKGIGDDGTCPSAVICDFSQFWGNHFDSPAFFTMMLYDYVNNTADASILDETCGNMSVFDKAIVVEEMLSKDCDETGLTFKKGPYNKRDWADEVNRNGYVTYNEVLYARSLYCLSKLCKLKKRTDSDKYFAVFNKVKDAINQILWDDKKGCYVNYKYGDFVEDNLSVDTAVAVLFGIADEVKSKRLLGNMQKVLETRNNSEQKAGDFGVMCVYPFYKGMNSAYRKSSQEYYYHNGANWPYLSAMYAYALRMYGMDYEYALTSWFDYNVNKENYTPVEYFSPCQNTGSLLQGWSSMGAFVMSDANMDFFRPKFVKD